MSNSPRGRNITNKLQPYWKDHPGQRDFVHGSYHLIRGIQHSVNATSGASDMIDMFYDDPKMINSAMKYKENEFKMADRDFARAKSHIIDGENRNDHINYNSNGNCNLF